MNILVPDSWLREFLKTSATPTQIKEYLSLCGPSVERITNQSKETIYEIEVTSNRPDSMSIFGIAREAAAILPRFGIKAKLLNDPYQIPANKLFKSDKSDKSEIKHIHIKTDPELNSRWTSVIIDDVKIAPSPKWLKKLLELTGIRAINNVIDITNYLMQAFGQPAHAFDYDEIKPKNGIPTMLLRAAKKGEQLTTLDGKKHILPGGDIVIEDGSGRLIDLCGIMGALNSSVKNNTKTILLFMQTYNPAMIRQTMMKLSHRTEAGSLFEKGLDSELVLPTVIKGIELVQDLTGGKQVSQIYDINLNPWKSYEVSLSRQKLNIYIGSEISDSDIKKILSSLGLSCYFESQSEPGEKSSKALHSKLNNQLITVKVPSFRRDIQIEEDIIEEIARIYGYHNIKARLPSTEPPILTSNPVLKWEEEMKVRLRDWGYTEIYTYSMISEKLMDIFGLNKNKVYKIANPLSSDWVYMRPSLLPSMLENITKNLHVKENLQLFEISHIYLYRPDNLPEEKPILLTAWTGDRFRQAKGLAQSVFNIFGVKFPQTALPANSNWWQKHKSLQLGEFGRLGLIETKLLQSFSIKSDITILDLDFSELVKQANYAKKYFPIPKYPPVIEDLTFSLAQSSAVGNIINFINEYSPLINRVEFTDLFENNATFKIYYLDKSKSLSDSDIVPVRQNLIHAVSQKFSAQLKGKIV